MNTNLKELNNYLFEELERLNADDELDGENLDREIKRSRAIANISQTIINNANLVLDAMKFSDESGRDTVPILLEAKNDKK